MELSEGDALSNMSDPKNNEELMNEYITEALEIIGHSTLLLGKSSEQLLVEEDIDALYRDIHTLKGSSQLFGFTHIGSLSHAVEAFLEPVRQKKIPLSEDFSDFVILALDKIEENIRNFEELVNPSKKTLEEFQFLIGKTIEIATQTLGGDLFLSSNEIPSFETNWIKLKKEESSMHLKVVPESRQNQEKQSSLETPKILETIKKDQAVSDEKVNDINAEASSVRVPVALLDKLMNLAGEMVLVRNQVMQHARSSEDNEYLNLTKKLDVVTTELQDEIMKTRMQPIGIVFSKFQRAVRDIGRSLDKKIELLVLGAETELDKSIIEAIKVPLTHIVRNSCDHGIESGDERKKKGKPEKGTVSLNAFQEGGQVVIEIKDDGKGLDTAKIGEKALEKGMVTAETLSLLSDSKINEMIFMPGFSTAASVTSVSGRGVGMDVVKTNIEKVGGSIEFSSVKDKGSTLRLKIPLTLAIVPAMIIRSDDEFYAIPQVKLQELLRIELEDGVRQIEKIQGKAFFRLRGDLLPLLELSRILKKQTGEFTKRQIYNIAVVKGDQRSYGLVLDEVCDTADIVVKPLNGFGKKVNIFSGATILGDGNVALILDIQGLSEISSVSGNLPTSVERSNNESPVGEVDEKVDYLVFSLPDKQIYSIPLVLIYRLEEFDSSKVEDSAGDLIVAYRGGILPLIPLGKVINESKMGKIAIEGSIQVLVIKKADTFYGLLVHEILDILNLTSEIQAPLRKIFGVFGTIITPSGDTITAIDALSILRKMTGETMHLEGGANVIPKFPNRKILLLEDSPFFIKQIKKLLVQADIKFEHVLNGVDALELLEKFGPNYFDLILSDIEMPKMNGYDFAKEVRKLDKYKNIKMFALTTRFSEADRARGAECGFNLYLEKLKPDELMNFISKEFEV